MHPRSDLHHAVKIPPETDGFPVPPGELAFGEVVSRFDRIVPGDPSRGFVPYYHFRILTGAGLDVGHVNLRIGDTEHIRMYAGHIGFIIAEIYRGRSCALQACLAIAPFVSQVYEEVIITCDPDNIASKRTIERLGAEFINEVPVPPHDPHYQKGSRFKRRYRWHAKP